MSKHLEKINNVVVKAIQNYSGKCKDTRLHLGYKVLNHAYANVAIFAPKNSGKPCSIFELVKQSVNDDCKAVVFFVSTLHNDVSYADMRAWLDMKNIPYVEYDSIFNEDDGHDQLLKIVYDLKEDAKKREMDYKTALKKAKNARERRFDDVEHKPFTLYDDPEEHEKKKKPAKYIVPE